jgi:hypothetical protein
MAQNRNILKNTKQIEFKKENEETEKTLKLGPRSIKLTAWLLTAIMRGRHGDCLLKAVRHV